MFLAICAWIIFMTVLLTAVRVHLRMASIVSLSVCFILMVQVGVRPVMFFLGLDSPAPYAWFAPNPWPLMTIALLLAALWLALLNSVALSFRGATGGAAFFPRMPHTPDLALIVFVGLVLTIISFGLTGYLVLTSGGLAQFVFGVKVGKDFAGLYVFREAATLSSAVLIYALLVSLKTGRENRGFLGKPLIIVLLILANLGTNYLWGNRYNIAVLTLAAGIAFHFYVRPLRVREVLLASAFLLAGLEGLKILRNALVSDVVGRDISNDFIFWHRISASLHFNQFDAFMLALRDVGDKFDFRQGKDALNGLLAWVPRFIYAEKETYHIGGWFRRVYEPAKQNGWPITVVGNWYVNFGMIGVFLGAAVSGVVVALGDQAFRAARVDPWMAATGSVIALQLFDGGVNFGFIQSYILLVIPLALIALFLRFVGRPAQVPRIGLSPPILDR